MPFYLGIDIGSVSTNVVLIDSQYSQDIRFSKYIRTNGQPIQSLQSVFKDIISIGIHDSYIYGVGITGSGRTLLGNIIGADCIKNEITAHAMAAVFEHPDVRTIIEIGGQDSKLIIVRDKVVVDFAMNTICAAGTGSFLDQQASRLNIPIEEFGQYAIRANRSARIAGRCTVFAESDMIHKQQQGATREEIIAGLCDALTRNYLNNVAKGKELQPPILFQGGVAFNKGIIKSFEKALNQNLIIPTKFNVMGAFGAALLAKESIEKRKTKTIFKGFDVISQSISFNLADCNDCSNKCELTQMKMENGNFYVWGDKCGKWQRSSK